MAKVFLGLGSNVGDRIRFIDNAIDEIEKIQNLKLVKRSFVYETEPWG
jgi:2-amino-4-hydroxy-6-hydroxymethyldihydropteridine diphosphokinase